MAEEEGVAAVKSDVAMSTSDQAAADSEEGALSDVMSQHTENKDVNTDIVVIESVDIITAADSVEKEEEDNTEEKFEIEPETEEPLSTEIPIESKESDEKDDDNASKHSDGQLTTDNEDEEMEIYTQNQNTNGKNYDNDGLNFHQPLNTYNGNLEYTVSQNFLIEGEGLENRLHDIRHNIPHLFNQMNIFKERLTDIENFDIDEFAATFHEMISVIDELSLISREFDELHEKISSEYFKCLDKYEENANICGGHLLNAKLNKARQIRNLIDSWNRNIEFYEAQITENTNFDEENEPPSYYDNAHNYQVLSRNIPSATTGYKYVADIPPPILPATFFVAPTALPSFSAETMNMNIFNDDSSENERTTELPTDLAPAPSSMSNAPPIANAPERPPSHNSPANYIPPMISLPTSLSFNTPPTMISSNILPPMNIPPPAMSLPLQNILQSQSNMLSQSTSDPKIILPPFQSNKPIPPKPASVLIPGLNIANTAPLFAQTPSLNPGMLSDTTLIPTQLPTVPLAGANYGAIRKQNPQIAPIINLNLSTMGSKSPAQNQISQSTSSSHIPSLLSIEVPFPIEILKRNQNQAQQQRFNNRSRRSPVVNTESKESITKEKESQSVKSDEPMDTTEQQSLTEETPDDPINDNPGS